MGSVVIVGGGFSGVVTAVNLVRLTDAPLAVTVVNTGYQLGRGIAYSTRRPEHLLNVVARNMSALADQPYHFVDWLATRSDLAELSLSQAREQFIPRRIYGDYPQGLFLWYRSAFADGKRVRIDQREAEAVDVVPTGNRVTVVTASGPPLKGMLWESTAVPELRNQAVRAAETVLRDLHVARAAAVRRLAATFADVMEYSI